MNYRFSTRFIRATIKLSLDYPLPKLRMLLKATGSTVSHITGLATLQSYFYELAYTDHKVGFALAEQQHHSRQTNTEYSLVIKGILTSQSAKPKNLGFPLSQAVRICPWRKQLPVSSIAALCLSLFRPLQWLGNTPPPKITTPVTRSRLRRSGSVSTFQFISHHVSSHPRPAGSAELQAHPHFCHSRQTCGRKLGQKTISVTPWAATLFCGY